MLEAWFNKFPLTKVWLKLLASHLYFALASYVTISIIAHNLGVESFGYYCFFLSLLFWLELVSAEAFRHPIFRACLVKEHLSQILRKQLLLILFLLVLLSLFASQLTLFFNLPGKELLIWIIALDLAPFGLYVSAVSILNAKERYRYKLILVNIYTTCKLIFMSSAALWFERLEYVLLGMVVASSVACAFAFKLCFSKIDDNDFYATAIEKSRVELKYFYSLFLVLACGLYQVIDLWFLQKNVALSQSLGYYGAAHSLVKVLHLISMSVLLLIFPRLVNTEGISLFSGDMQTRMLFFILISSTFVVSIALILFSQSIVRYLFGANYQEASDLLLYLSPSTFLLVFYLSCAQLLFHMNAFRLSLFALFVSLTGYAILIPSFASRFGVIGVVLSMLLSVLLGISIFILYFIGQLFCRGQK